MLMVAGFVSRILFSMLADQIGGSHPADRLHTPAGRPCWRRSSPSSPASTASMFQRLFGLGFARIMPLLSGDPQNVVPGQPDRLAHRRPIPLRRRRHGAQQLDKRGRSLTWQVRTTRRLTGGLAFNLMNFADRDAICAVAAGGSTDSGGNEGPRLVVRSHRQPVSDGRHRITYDIHPGKWTNA